jgi:type IV fimbrial biogenesis protein FimT
MIMCPFVCHKMPSVCHLEAGITPYVGKSIPFVDFGNSQTGFTLIELIISLVVAAILFGIAAPNLANIIREHRLSGQVNGFVADLNFARSEAIQRNTAVTVCKSGDPFADPPVCTTTSTTPWTTGWVIFVDTGTNGQFDAATDTVLRRHQALENNIGLYTDDCNSGIANNITYLGNGVLRITGTPTVSCGPANPDNYNMYFCDQRGPGQARSILVSSVGRARVSGRGQIFLVDPNTGGETSTAITAANCS